MLARFSFALFVVVVGCGEMAIAGAVRIDEAPDGTLLYIDAQPAGPAALGTEIRVTSGSHVLEARNGAHVVAHAVVDVGAGATVSVRLVPDALVAASASVEDPIGVEPYGDPPGLAAPAPRDPVAMPDPDTTGAPLGSDEIARVVGEHRGQLNRCFETALSSDPSMGPIRGTVSLTIDPDGRVTSATARGIPSASLTGCIVRAARRWTFPTSTGESTVEVPVVFTSAR